MNQSATDKQPAQAAKYAHRVLSEVVARTTTATVAQLAAKQEWL